MRNKPYTVIGVRRLKCTRCGAKAEHQWRVCALGCWMPICVACDIMLNAMVLKWMRVANVDQKIRRYKGAS